MNKVKIKKLIAIVLLSLSLLFGGFNVAKAHAVPSKGKILIYHSHGNEKNKDSTIFEMGEDLKIKLEKKGYIVEHVTTDFSKNDYNNAYYNARKMLDSKDLFQYSLIIDQHTDSGESATTTTINNKEVAKIMFVQTKNNPNLKQENEIANGISKELLRFGDISKGVYAEYNKGINYYNLDKNPNMVLLEMGNENNTYLEVRLSDTYVASAIDLYLNNK